MPKIVSLHALQSGTDYLNLTANLAVSIARQGNRVGVINPGTQASAIHTLFGVDHEAIDPALNLYLWGEASHDAAFLTNLSVKVESGEVTLLGGGVYLAPSRIRLDEIPYLLTQGYDLERLSENFFELCDRLKLDFLFIETPPSLSEETLLLLALSDVLLLILYLTDHDFQEMAVAVDVARQLGVPQVLMIADHVMPEFQHEGVKQQLEELYGDSVVDILPFTPEMTELPATDIFCLRYPEHPWTAGIQAIAQRLLATNPNISVEPFLT